MKITVCPGCFKGGETHFCRKCRQLLFDGKKVDHVLPFSLPEYNRVKIEQTAKISISGVQSKHSIKLNGRILELTDTGGQFILKPISEGPFENLDQMPANEHCTMQIARQIFNIPAAACAIVFFKDDFSPAYITRRFDVLGDGTHLHQEDFAQIAQMSEETNGQNYKYDLSYEEIALLMKQFVSAYPVEVEKYFSLVLFNYLVHNGDAHLKNFSLFRNSETVNTFLLTPAYDLLNTRLHLPDESAMALPLFKDNYQTKSFERNGFYARDDFVEFGKRLSVKDKRIDRILDNIANKNDAVIELLQRSFLKVDQVNHYTTMISDRARALTYSFEGSQNK